MDIYKDFDEGKVDFRLRDKPLARRYGCNISVARRLRKKAGLPPSNRLSHWDHVDWSRTRAAIAEELGCTVGRVYQVAQQRGKQKNRRID